MDRKFNNNIITIVILILMFGFSLFLVFGEKNEFSSNENRYLEKFPKFSFKNLKSGKFTNGLSSYLSDHFYNRDLFMNIKTNTEKLLGKTKINDVYISGDYLISAYENPVNSDKIIRILNEFNDKLNYVNMELMLVPTSVTINKDKLPKFSDTKDELETLNYIYNGIHFNKINVYDALMEGNKQYQMFYYTDHHWTSYGAYYAYLEYCKNNNIEPIAINDFEIKEVTNDFYGTLYSKTNDYNRKSDSIHIFIPDKNDYVVNYVASKVETNSLYEDKYLNEKDKYSYFLDNNHPLIVITNNDVDNNKELLVIKDSFANSMVPFLVNHYSKVHVIDPRYYLLNISDYVKENRNINDVLILYNMNTVDNDTGIVSIN